MIVMEVNMAYLLTAFSSWAPEARSCSREAGGAADEVEPWTRFVAYIGIHTKQPDEILNHRYLPWEPYEFRVPSTEEQRTLIEAVERGIDARASIDPLKGALDEIWAAVDGTIEQAERIGWEELMDKLTEQGYMIPAEELWKRWPPKLPRPEH